MSFATLPLLFNGLFFSISPAAVHSAAPKPTAALTYHQPTGLLHIPNNSTVAKTIRVQVSFMMNDKKELQVISVSGAAPDVNAAIMQNLGNWMPGMKSYLTANKTYSFTVEIYNQKVS